MKHLLIWTALLTQGCLEPGRPYLTVRDSTPPTVLETIPGPSGLQLRREPMIITFTEPMEPRSLRPGINLYLGADQVGLDLTVPRPEPVAADTPYTVTAVPTEGELAADATYQIYLRTLLTDLEGNAMTSEVRVTFFTGVE